MMKLIGVCAVAGAAAVKMESDADEKLEKLFKKGKLSYVEF